MGWGPGGFVLLALSAFIPSVISIFLSRKIKNKVPPPAPPLDPLSDIIVDTNAPALRDTNLEDLATEILDHLFSVFALYIYCSSLNKCHAVS